MYRLCPIAKRRCTLLLILVMGPLMGCGKVLRHSGAVNMGGDINMTGDMNVRGTMEMSDVKASVSLATDNRKSPLKAVAVAGEPIRTEMLAVLDVDDFLVDRNISGLGVMGENPVALFREKIDAIRQDSDVKAVVLRIDSPGGGVTASDMMCHELTQLKLQRDLPVVACIMGVGTGGAYYLANHCDAIIAHPTSIVGGVGVILNAYNLEDTMGQFNILSLPIKSGDKIDAGTPERPISEDELFMLQQIADSFHQRFIDQVQTRRPGLGQVADRWTDGSVMTGKQAKQLGLVDEVGYLDDAIEFAKQQAGLGPQERVVMYRRDNDDAHTPLDISPNRPAGQSLLPLHVPGLDRSSMPTFLYMWQADPSMATLARP